MSVLRSLLPQNKLEMNFYQVLGNFYTYIIYLGGTFSNSSLCYSGKYIFSHFAEKRDENERIIVVIPGFGEELFYDWGCYKNETAAETLLFSRHHLLLHYKYNQG